MVAHKSLQCLYQTLFTGVIYSAQLLESRPGTQFPGGWSFWGGRGWCEAVQIHFRGRVRGGAGRPAGLPEWRSRCLAAPSSSWGRVRGGANGGQRFLVYAQLELLLFRVGRRVGGAIDRAELSDWCEAGSVPFRGRGSRATPTPHLSGRSWHLSAGPELPPRAPAYE